MHIDHAVIALAGMYAGMYAMDRWYNRPSARARYARLSLHDKITYQVLSRRIISAGLSAVLVLLASLYAAGILPFGGWLIYTIITSANLAVNLYMLRRVLAARRAYNDLGPLAYLAEIKHAFKTLGH